MEAMAQDSGITKGQAAVVVGVGVAAVLGIVGRNVLFGDEQKVDAAPSAQIGDEVRGALTVNTTSVDCVKVVEQTGMGRTYNRGDSQQPDKGVVFDVGALHPVASANAPGADDRLWSDAISPPFHVDKKDNKALLAETEASICEDPVLGATVANLFVNMQVQGIKVVDLNPWLKPFEGDAANINDRAVEFMPLLNNNNPSQDQLKQAVDKSREYQKIAEKLGTLLERFKNNGVGNGKTVLNFHLVAGGLVAGALPEVGLNPDQFDNAEALMLVLDSKNGQCLAQIGFNTGDKRPEEFECQPVTTTTTITVESKPPGTPPMSFRTTTTPETTFPLKDPSKDYNAPPHTAPNNGPGSGGVPGGTGTTSTTEAPTTQPNTTTTVARGSTTTTSPPTTQPPVSAG